MSLVLATSTHFDLESYRQRAADDVGPSHSVTHLAAELGAEVVQPDGSARTADHIGARIVGSPEHWDQARRILAAEPDVVYALGEDIGLVLALRRMATRQRFVLASYVLSPNRGRTAMLLRALHRLGAAPDQVLIGTEHKARQLGELGFSGDEVAMLPEQGDADFFRPLDTPSPTERPWIVSVGLEQRDYRTLAAATGDLDVDVRVCAVSPNHAQPTSAQIPRPMPNNMEMRHFDWPELRELYQRAAVTVVPLVYNEFSAGLTALMEATLCGSPAILTETPGYGAELIERGLVVGVPAGDAKALQRAIGDVLADPSAAQARADKAREFVLANNTAQHLVQSVAGHLRRLSPGVIATDVRVGHE